MYMAMWGDKASMPIHVLHMAFGVGSLIAPLVVGPFLSIPGSTNQFAPSDLNTTMDPLFTMLTNETLNDTTPTRIYIPYAIFGCVGFAHVRIW